MRLNTLLLLFLMLASLIFIGCNSGKGGTKIVGVACNNSEYTVNRYVIRNANIYINKLSDESMEKLRNAIHEEGDSALDGISDLTCITHLYLRDMNVSKEACQKLKENLTSYNVKCPQCYNDSECKEWEYCKRGGCVTKEGRCNPNFTPCRYWEECNETHFCILEEGYCASDEDCELGQNCGTNHKCEES